MMAAALIMSGIMKRAGERKSMQHFFGVWKADCEVNRIMENAFNKVLEMNHRHVKARISSGSNLLASVLIENNRRITHSVFEELQRINSSYIS